MLSQRRQGPVTDFPEVMLDQHGAVSEETAIAMATGACEKIWHRLWPQHHWIRRPHRWHPDAPHWFHFPGLCFSSWGLGKETQPSG